MISEYVKPSAPGEKVLVIYPKNEVLFAVFKLITRIHGIEKVGWYAFNDVAKRRLESVFEMFKDLVAGGWRPAHSVAQIGAEQIEHSRC